MKLFSPPRRIRRRVPLVLLAFAIPACSDATGIPDEIGPPGQIVIRTQPTAANVGAPVSQQPVVEIQDCWNRLIDTTGLVVLASVASGNATILDGAEAVSEDGIASFENLTIVGRVGTPVVLRFSIVHRSGSGFTVRNSEPINLLAGAPATIRPAEQANYSGSVGTAVAPAPSVVVVDAGQNPVPGVTVTFVVTQGWGRLQDSVATTDANGVARLGSWTLGLPGTNRIAARSGSLETVFTAAATSAIGYLRLSTTGRPNAAPARVRVVRTTLGSPTYDQTHDVADSVTISDIPFGQYAVIGDSINVGQRIWLPKASFANQTVSSTQAPDVVLEYTEHGRIEATVRGLPVPNYPVNLAVVQVDGPLTGTIFARNDAVVRALLPLGTYDIIAPAFIIDGDRWDPNPARQTIVVRPGDQGVTPINVLYSIATGRLAITLTGLPSGATAQVDVVGPNGFRQTFFMSGTRTLTGLEPGAYAVTASPTTFSGTTYNPTPASQAANVVAGSVSTVTFSYAP